MAEFSQCLLYALKEIKKDFDLNHEQEEAQENMSPV
jgi:hypothetical protein